MDEAHILVMCSGRTMSNGPELEHRKFHANMWKTFTVRVGELWDGLPREVVEVMTSISSGLGCLSGTAKSSRPSTSGGQGKGAPLESDFIMI